MGRNSQQRRAVKKRRIAAQQRGSTPGGRPPGRSNEPTVRVDDASTTSTTGTTASLDDAALDRRIVEAARYALGGEQDKHAFAAAMAVLTDIELDPPTAKRPSARIAMMLQRDVARLFESGWQPADVAHAVKREWTARATRLVIALIAGHARTADAATRAPHAWLNQLEDLGVYDPRRAVIIGGHDGVTAWARAERLFADEALAISLQVLAQTLMSPPLSTLIEPPSAWGATNRGSSGKLLGAARGDIDAKALKVIRALLAKAEATTFDAEAESFTAKAQELMTRHSIDAAVLASAAKGAGAGIGIESRRVHIDSPYADEKAGLLSVIADVNGARCVWSPHVGFATVMGFAVDLHLTDLLFTSLLVQATRASAEATSTDARLRTPSFRRAFLIAYAHRIGERLAATKQHAAGEAAQQYGAALVPILADRAAAVDAAYTQAFP
ncbi:MAG: DUF2786 domain-containing protein, partial [Ilumatobacteraceae bacterium]